MLLNVRKIEEVYVVGLALDYCVGLTALICYGLMKGKIGGINTWTMVLILLLSYCIVTFFIDIHADAAEGLQISYLLDYDLHR